MGGSGGWYAASSHHPGGVDVGMADGSVRFIAETVDTGDSLATTPDPTSGRSPYGVWGALGTMAAGDHVKY